MPIQVYVRRAGFAKREAVPAYMYGKLALHKAVDVPNRWSVTHPASGMSATGGRRFDSRAQARRYADEIQKHLDFDKLTEAGDPWDVQKAFGSENIRRAVAAALQEAFGV